MAKRRQNISITVMPTPHIHHLSVWCDSAYSLREQIEGIEGVGSVGMSPQTETFDNIWVGINGCYDINEVAEEIRALVDG